MVVRISDRTLKGRKPHKCFHCERLIGKGVLHHKETLIYDDHIYDLRFHLDCDELFRKYEKDAGFPFYDDEGHPGLLEDWQESGEFEQLCNTYRGYFPHVVCRLEFNQENEE